ncbi:hypothetical protein M9435_006298 [Picochlorum sp. BPE23]|nr:hypothetical protein M9435_006298 [Picochlorum sp. BPE23]
MSSENSDTSLAAILERLKHCGEKILEFEVGWGTTIDLGEVKRTPSVPEQVKISIYPSERFVAFKENGQELVDFGFQRGQITRDSKRLLDDFTVGAFSTNLQVITAAENIRRSASTRDYAFASANMKSVKLVFMPEEHSLDISHGESIPGKMEWEWCSPISSNKEQVDRVQTWTLTIGHYFR